MVRTQREEREARESRKVQKGKKTRRPRLGILLAAMANLRLTGSLSREIDRSASTGLKMQSAHMRARVSIHMLQRLRGDVTTVGRQITLSLHAPGWTRHRSADPTAKDKGKSKTKALAKVQATSSSAPAAQPINSSSGFGGTGGADTFDADPIKAAKEVHAPLKPMRTAR